MIKKLTKTKIIGKKEIILLILIIILIPPVILWNSLISKKITEVCFKDNCFKAEIAESRIKSYLGLMFKENLPENRGMLFIFEEPNDYYFWMKNVRIPLDIIFMNEEKKVIYLYENAQPCGKNQCPAINAGQPVKYVLEINAGQAKKMDINTKSEMIITPAS